MNAQKSPAEAGLSKFSVFSIRNLHTEVSLLNSHRLAGLNGLRNLLHDDVHQEKPYCRKHATIDDADGWAE